jgi:hypothetical protein
MMLMDMIGKVLTVVVAVGGLGFFIGSVMDSEMVYTLSGCVAAWAGLVLAVKGRQEQTKKGG